MSSINGGGQKRILVTGGAGGLGAHAVRRLVRDGHTVRVFDLPTPANQKAFPGGDPSIEPHWGDITKPESIREAVKGMDEVLHMAAIVPPLSEKNPALGRAVNIDGTKNVVHAAQDESEKAGREIRLRFTSSATVFGVTYNEKPPISVEHSLNPTDNYTEGKVAAEGFVRESCLPFTIFRLSAIMYLAMRPGDFAAMKIIAPETRVEFGHLLDVAEAFANSMKNDESLGGTFILAGGEKCRMTYKEIILKMFGMFGFPEPNWKSFAKEVFYLDWYDTAESQRILKFQSRTFDDYLNDFQKAIGARYYLIRCLAAPLLQLLRIHL